MEPPRPRPRARRRAGGRCAPPPRSVVCPRARAAAAAPPPPPRLPGPHTLGEPRLALQVQPRLGPARAVGWRRQRARRVRQARSGELQRRPPRPPDAGRGRAAGAGEDQAQPERHAGPARHACGRRGAPVTDDPRRVTSPVARSPPGGAGEGRGKRNRATPGIVNGHGAGAIAASCGGHRGGRSFAGGRAAVQRARRSTLSPGALLTTIWVAPRRARRHPGAPAPRVTRAPRWRCARAPMPSERRPPPRRPPPRTASARDGLQHGCRGAVCLFERGFGRGTEFHQR
jgi:hypothetical protein